MAIHLLSAKTRTRTYCDRLIVDRMPITTTITRVTCTKCLQTLLKDVEIETKGAISISIKNDNNSNL